MDWVSDTFELLIPMIGIVATFTFVGVIVWSRHRRTERDAYYRHELVKQMAEKGAGEDQLLAFMKEEVRVRQQSRRQGLIVGGLVTLALGLGHMVAFLLFMEEIWALGAIPALIGLALIASGFLYGAGEKKSV